ncbi:aldehyde dehydrogenase family protein [Paracoccus pantotrophus]|uniref:aldehyde dehydrogenase family protein n=1 Tax=Paracoccus pantotrophus TaxID=82367 RepID=UPI00056BAAD7|nr:aldehyde dehydrogenase family protein [Paracoccus pantotrophus]
MTAEEAEVKKTHNFVGGKWIPAQATGEIEVINPATEEVFAVVPEGIAADVPPAVEAAAAAFPDWSESTIEQRADMLRKFARLTEARAEELTFTGVSEVGQPATAARVFQTQGAVGELDLMAEILPEMDWNIPEGKAVVRRVAGGVVGAITAWNGPLRSVISKAGAAMAAGCTVVVKPSEVAPMTAYIFAEICEEAGLPPGVFNLVSGTGPVVGEAIVAHSAVDIVSLTGSVRAGRRVMEVAAQDIKRVHLELGGKSANILFEDADIDHAISVGIEDAFRNAGQVCGGLTRILVPRTLLAKAEEAAKAKAESFVIGDPFDPATTLGPVATAAARERIRGYINLGQQEGARMITGGAEPPRGLNRGFFVKPTVFSGDNSMRIAQEEIFGPVVVIIPFDGEDDAVRIANDSAYGLAGGLWCRDVERARAIARRIRTGRVRINGTPLEKRAPHGGFKHSGIGREWGRYGIEEFLEYQSIIG